MKGRPGPFWSHVVGAALVGTAVAATVSLAATVSMGATVSSGVNGFTLDAVGGATLAAHYLEALGASSTPQENAPYDAQYHFVRIEYSSGRGGGFGGFGRRRGGDMWAHDWPRAEWNFLAILKETTFVRTERRSANVFRLDDPELFRHPIAYIVEVGSWEPTDEEVEALGDYLNKGGFLIVDDTRLERGHELRNFEFHMKRALPDLSLMSLDYEHDVFDSFFRIDPLQVIPSYGPRNVQYYGVFEDDDPSRRLMVLLNLNNDIAEYWEFSDQGYLPIDLTNEAYKLGVNYVVYGLTH